MECACRNKHDNIYRHYRKKAAVYNDNLASMEKAAEQLGISVSSLNQYELGITKSMPVDMVVLMADVYNAPELRNNYCKNECPIGRQLPIAVSSDSLQGTTIKLLQAFDEDEIKSLKKDLIRIAADGKVDEAEKQDFKAIVKSLDVLSENISKLRMHAEKEMKHD